MYSQHKEEEVILNYFENIKHQGSLLSIGENDGKTFSNALALIEKGWLATLVEPDERALNLLYQWHAENERVEIFPYAIDDEDSVDVRKKILHINDPHIQGDTGLLSTLIESEKNRWNGLGFKTQEVECINYKRLLVHASYSPYDFINIDCEGLDYDILKQIDLSTTSLVCVEHNGKEIEKYISYGEKFGLKEIHRNGENIILSR